ncbi:hypothetical protein JCM10207_005929 [Rhodosporidiobolus poonsookiae]
MPLSYSSDDSPATSRSITPHLRRRSSISHSSLPSSRASPTFGHSAFYNEKTGEIALPPSPPLRGWDDKKEKNALGLYDGAGRGGPQVAWRPAPKGRPFTLPRPWYTAIALGGVTLAFVFLLTYLVPPSAPYQPTSIITRLRSSRNTCDPYAAPGTLEVDPIDADRNRWRPFDPKCQPLNFMAKMRELALHHHNPDSDSTASPAISDFNWLRGKTALLVGDSISREHVENFCQLLGEESEVVRPSHRWSASNAPQRAATKAQHLLERPKRLHQRGFRVVRDASRPRVCYVPKFDFLLVSVFHFGLDQEDYWRDSRMPQYAAPGLFEHRLMDQIQPLIANIRADGRASAPDYVEITSGTWDLARWAEQDLVAQKDTTEPLGQDRITWYRFRVGQMMDKIRTAFPDAKAKVWRTLHFPTDQVAEFDYFMDKINPRSANASTSEPVMFSHNRIQQLDQAIRSLVHPSTSAPASSPSISPSDSLDADDVGVPHPEFRINEWGNLLKGHEAHQRDRLHGDPLPGGVVWADTMLYNFFEGVKRSEQLPMRGRRN